MERRLRRLPRPRRATHAIVRVLSRRLGRRSTGRDAVQASGTGARSERSRSPRGPLLGPAIAFLALFLLARPRRATHAIVRALRPRGRRGSIERDPDQASGPRVRSKRPRSPRRRLLGLAAAFLALSLFATLSSEPGRYVADARLEHVTAPEQYLERHAYLWDDAAQPRQAALALLLLPGDRRDSGRDLGPRRGAVADRAAHPRAVSLARRARRDPADARVSPSDRPRACARGVRLHLLALHHAVPASVEPVPLLRAGAVVRVDRAPRRARRRSVAVGRRVRAGGRRDRGAQRRGAGVRARSRPR